MGSRDRERPAVGAVGIQITGVRLSFQSATWFSRSTFSCVLAVLLVRYDGVEAVTSEPRLGANTRRAPETEIRDSLIATAGCCDIISGMGLARCAGRIGSGTGEKQIRR